MKPRDVVPKVRVVLEVAMKPGDGLARLETVVVGFEEATPASPGQTREQCFGDLIPLHGGRRGC